jgi:hypothetical protein
VRRVETLTAATWSLDLGQHGEVVEDVAEIEQSLRLLLATPKGSVELAPTFGADVWRWLDAPGPTAAAGILAEITDAVKQWEPRVAVIAVVTERAPGRLTIRLDWQPVAGGETRSLEVR